LDSTLVDLHNEHIIWYALVQSLCCSLNLLENPNKFKDIAQILY
jgi:hypothetical protein